MRPPVSGTWFNMSSLNGSNRIDFNLTESNGNNVPLMSILSNGNVGIGTTRPSARLTVKGGIHAEEVKVDLSVPGPDYVFKKGYDLLTIEEVQNHINQKGHLPNIPSATQMEKEGIELGIMNMKLLEKIEELTLYTIAQEKQLKKQPGTRSPVIRLKTEQQNNFGHRSPVIRLKTEQKTTPDLGHPASD